MDWGEGRGTLSFVLIKTFQEFAAAADHALRVVRVVCYFSCSLFECLFYRQFHPKLSHPSSGDELATSERISTNSSSSNNPNIRSPRE